MMSKSGNKRAIFRKLTTAILTAAIAAGGIGPPPRASAQNEPFTFADTYLVSPAWTGAATLTVQPAQVIEGQRSATASSNQGAEWVEFLHSSPSATGLPLEAGESYTVRFKYKILTAPGAGGYVYFFADTASGGSAESKGWIELTGAVGTIQTASASFTLNDRDDYKLIWGLRKGGAVSIDDIVVEKNGRTVYEERFENRQSLDLALTKLKTPPVSDGSAITAHKPLVVSGNQSLYAKSKSGAEWNEIIYSESAKLPLQANHTYTVVFQYKIIRTPGDYLYFFARSPSGGDSSSKGWTELTGAAGGVYQGESTFTLENRNDYYLVWGLRNGGEVSIDNIAVYEAGKLLYRETFEVADSGDYSNTYFLSPSGTGTTPGLLTPDPARSVTGIAVYAEGTTGSANKDFLRTDELRLRLKPNASYTVRFRYKVVGALSDYGYFVARSAAGGTSADRGTLTLTGTPGAVYSAQSDFTLGNETDYALSWGIRNGGSIAIDEIVVVKDGVELYREDFEPEAAWTDDHQEPVRLALTGAGATEWTEAEHVTFLQAEDLYGTAALSGGWSLATTDWAGLNRSLRLVSRPSEAASMTLRFNGTGIALYGMRNSWNGQIAWSLDNGVQSGVIDEYVESGYVLHDEVLQLAGLPSGNHTLTLTAMSAGYEKHSPWWTEWQIWLDYIRIIEGQLNDPNLSSLRGSGWTTVAGSSFSGGQAVQLNVGGQLHGSFYGDRFELSAQKQPGGGTLTVYIDDVPYTASLAAGSTSVQPVLTVGDLPRGKDGQQLNHKYRIVTEGAAATIDRIGFGREQLAAEGTYTVDVPSFGANQRLAAVAVQAFVGAGTTLTTEALDAGGAVLAQTDDWLLDLGSQTPGTVAQIRFRLKANGKLRSPELEAFYLLPGRLSNDASAPAPIQVGTDTGTVKEVKEAVRNGIGNFVWLPKPGMFSINDWSRFPKIDIFRNASYLQQQGYGFMVSQRRGIGDVVRPVQVVHDWASDTTPDIYTEQEIRALHSIGGNYFLGAFMEEMDISMIQGALRTETRNEIPGLYGFSDKSGGRASYESEIQTYANRYQGWGTQALVNNGVTYQHATYRAGADMVVAELQEHMLSDGLQLAYLRGSSHQFGKPFGVWISLWHYLKIPSADRLMVHWQNQASIGGPSDGYSANELKASLYASYYSGASLLTPQDSVPMFTDRGRDGDWQPSPWAKTLEQFRQHTAAYPAGTPAKRVAFMIDKDNGWSPANLWQGFPTWSGATYPYGNPVGHNWGKLNAGLPELMQREMYEAIYPGSDQNGLTKYPGTFTDTPYGQVDVVASDISSAKLAEYDAIIVVGEMNADQALVNKLTSFVDDGGWLIANASQFQGFGSAGLWGGQFGSTTATDSSIQVSASELFTHNQTFSLGTTQYRYYPFTAGTASVIGATGDEQPLIVRNQVGAGKVFLTLSDYELTTDSFPNAALLPTASLMIGSFIGRFNKQDVEVSTAAGVEYLSFVQSNGKPGIVLINHGAAGASVDLRWPGASSSTAADVLAGASYSLTIDGAYKKLDAFPLPAQETAVILLQ
ncbi:hypothetical protein ACF3MZ_00410 [Paenibacillaceae bacterium WGS1546]|uniref:hypothetical protein n=1 Tax=Cohnella sp. WGS1546 TaxID=3366810 RepID=UPI00372D8702